MASEDPEPTVFVCHASEDKADVARPIADSLRRAGVQVWFDEYSLAIGDSLRRAIDQGLSSCRWGVVVFSPAFFAKPWPQAELDGLFAKEISGEKTILPVWHNVDRAAVMARSPLLVDRVAARTAEGIDDVVRKVLDAVDPNKAHRTVTGQTIAATPMALRLHSGQWAVTTPLTITNMSDKPAYAVQVKLTIDPPDLDPASIKIQPDQPRTSVRGRVINVEMNPDVVLYYLTDSQGRQCVSIWMHTLDARSTREIVISGTKPQLSSARVELWTFQHSPPELLRQGNKNSIPISFPEAVTLNSMAMVMRRIG